MDNELHAFTDIISYNNCDTISKTPPLVGEVCLRVQHNLLRVNQLIMGVDGHLPL